MKYKVQSIDRAQAVEWLLKKHYARRRAPVLYCFGLFNIDGILQGIITFGISASAPLNKIFSPFILLELNRLCVNDGLEKNVLSFFVSQAINLLPKPAAIISFADTSRGHIGYIYQATNFIYTGLSAKRTDWKIKGKEHLHPITIADISRGKENRVSFMREKFGDDFYLKERARKHRYFYFIGTKHERAKIAAILPYKIEPYPKGETKRYDTSFSITVQMQLQL